ncbi:MAG: 4Fe-4S dicluster domain-containing protein [Planctomycetota bacterium]|nr:4Fe-4S dicluster domain-containing protein [Planctomycetota bacterium]
MTSRVDPNLRQEMILYGAEDLTKCINCGNCTAVCALSEGDNTFPRQTIRHLQLGLKDKLLAAPEPWLCYYCGECTDTCPRDANPGEIMMATRRWLTAQYDHSGHAHRLYTSPRRMWTAIVIRALIPLVILALYHILYPVFTGNSAIITDRVALNRFAPVMWVWAAVVLHFLFLSYRVASGTLTMSRHVLGANADEGRIPLSAWVGEFRTFLLHFFTQKRWRECGDHQRRRWLEHLFFVSGYVIMLVLIVGLLGWFQTDAIYPVYHPQRWLGYYATIALMYGALSMLIGRIRKREAIHKVSELSDWLFPGLILVGAVTGILVHFFRYAGWPWPTYLMYVVHVMAMVAMLDVEVGIGKWMHMIYRPLAMYLIRVRARRTAPAAAEGAAAPASP